eukprot:scaffold424_cov165-Ochromonas_danica.AAC.16
MSSNNNCTSCRKGFYFVSFKYTCPGCGRVFCSNCLNQQILFSEEDVAPKIIVKDITKPQRCCQDCYNRISSKPPPTPVVDILPSPITANIDELYQVGRVLGEGGFGVVKEGTRIKDGSKVAVKMVLKEKVPPEEESAIYNEVKILSQVDHKNIVHLHDFLVEPSCYYIIMECVTGGELFDRIVKKTVYNELEARELVVILLRALKYCHDRHIVHRDLKPENLLMTSEKDDADIKIVDFGFATIAATPNITEAVGTPTYIAPEVLLGDPYGKPVDMWAFGVILYILLGGYPPFNDQDQAKLFKKITRGAYQFHIEYWQGISGEAKDLIRGLLVLDQRERFTVDQALAHPWVRASEQMLQDHNLESNLKELRKFQAAKKWKVGFNAVRAVNKLKKLKDFAFSIGDVTMEIPHTLEARFELGKVLGEGGYAVVKKGTSKMDRSPVAVKVVKRASMTESQEQSLKREVEILTALNYPNIVRALDFFEERDYFYVIMELITGGELFDRIVKKVFYAEKDARDLAFTLLKAIKYLHDQNIVHRDLKPENLLLTSDDNDADIKVVDFGFATKTDGDYSLTDHCGTPGYIAPEILRNETYGRPADMWSFGIILYILLGGYPPFYDKNTQVLFRKIMRGNFEFHPAYWAEVSDEAKDLISRLLNVRPADRYTVDQALAHPWFAEVNRPVLGKRMLTKGLGELRKFTAKRKLRAGIKAIMTINRMMKLASVSRSNRSESGYLDVQPEDIEITLSEDNNANVAQT